MVRVVEAESAISAGMHGQKIVTANELGCRRQAKEIVEQANISAQAIEAKAREQADALLKKARSEAEAQKALNLLELEQQHRQRWQETMNSLESSLSGIVRDGMQALLEQTPDEQKVQALVSHALRNVRERQNLIVRVPESCLPLISSAFPDLQCEVSSNQLLACEVELGDTLIVASMTHLEQQLEARLLTDSSGQ